jgi:hypothetical protein
MLKRFFFVCLFVFLAFFVNENPKVEMIIDVLCALITNYMYVRLDMTTIKILCQFTPPSCHSL